jgi:hypothetical protein
MLGRFDPGVAQFMKNPANLVLVEKPPKPL